MILANLGFLRYDMSTILLTVIIAFVVLIIAMSLLAISWLITGKSRIKPGACGRDPTKNRDKDCSTSNSSCGLCEKKDNK